MLESTVYSWKTLNWYLVDIIGPTLASGKPFYLHLGGDPESQASQRGSLAPSKTTLSPARECNLAHSGVPWLPRASQMVPRVTQSLPQWCLG